MCSENFSNGRIKAIGNIHLFHAFQVLCQLFFAACTREHRCDTPLSEYPSQGFAGERLSPTLCLVVEFAQTVEHLGCECIFPEMSSAGYAAVLGYAVKITVGEQTLRQRRE